MPTVIKGQPTSAEIVSRLKADGRPVALACSLGKDSLAAWVALEEAGIEVVPVYFWSVPRLPLIEENVKQIEKVFGVKIHQEPHPRFFRMLDEMTLQPPERIATIMKAGMEKPDYDDLWPMIKEDLGLPPDAWVCDGVRACDSIQRRASLTRNGVMKRTTHKASVIADWTKSEVMDALERRGIGLPPDYELFGRSFDGLDERFMRPLRENRPEDYEAVKQWFPFVEADILRHDHYGAEFTAAAKARGKAASDSAYRDRAKADVKRYKLAVDSGYWACFCFSTQSARDRFADAVGADGEFAFGDQLESVSTKPESPRRGFAPKSVRMDRTAPDPMDYLSESDGTVNGDALAMADALMDAFRECSGRESRCIYNSPYHVTVIFPSRDKKDAFAAEYGISRYGYDYFDGDKAAQALGIDI